MFLIFSSTVVPVLVLVLVPVVVVVVVIVVVAVVVVVRNPREIRTKNPNKKN